MKKYWWHRFSTCAAPVENRCHQEFFGAGCKKGFKQDIKTLGGG
jgi:hypothetical protein